MHFFLPAPPFYREQDQSRCYVFFSRPRRPLYRNADTAFLIFFMGGGQSPCPRVSRGRRLTHGMGAMMVSREQAAEDFPLFRSPLTFRLSPPFLLEPLASLASPTTCAAFAPLATCLWIALLSLVSRAPVAYLEKVLFLKSQDYPCFMRIPFFSRMFAVNHAFVEGACPYGVTYKNRGFTILHPFAQFHSSRPLSRQ